MFGKRLRWSTFRIDPLLAREMTTATCTRNPLILILGATGTGKSNLAIQIAQSICQNASVNPHDAFTGAEIINADAMQLYRGLPIITNKVTPAEQGGIPHHLLDHIGLEEEPWTVQRYVKEADRMIEEIRSRGNLPIVVGGTSYYVQGLLFRNALLQNSDGNDNLDTAHGDEGFGSDAAKAWPILNADTPEIYAKLQELDPEMASTWHPNDRRRIQRSLEICLRSGRKASEIYQEQKNITHSNEVDSHDTNSALSTNTSLRYDPIVFWLEAEDQILKERLNKRVDAMVENGLLVEAQAMATFVHDMGAKSIPLDQSKGIWVSIGYKELLPWINELHEVEPTRRHQDIVQQSCIEAVKAGTRQYAKRQNRFVRIRFAKALTSAGGIQKLFLLDCTDLARWQENVFSPALSIVNRFFEGAELPVPSSLSELARKNLTRLLEDDDGQDERYGRKCEICDKILMSEKQWVNHINSRSHKRVLQNLRKKQQNRDGTEAVGTSSSPKMDPNWHHT